MRVGPTERVPSGAELLSRLLRFDTTNPPGAEADCIAFAEGLLRAAGLETKLVESRPGRPNLIARLPGAAAALPCCCTATSMSCPRPSRIGGTRRSPGSSPRAASGDEVRSTLKGAVAMMLGAVLRAKRDGVVPPGDVILALPADEEAASDHGAAFLVANHPELFAGARFAIGEFGGFSYDIVGRRFYPIQVAEKQICWTRLTIHGPAGHGSMPRRGGTTATLAEILRRLDRRPLPVQ